MAALTVLMAAAWILPGLIGHDPWKPDEAYTFGLVHSLLQGGSWAVPMLAGEPYLNQPPLFVLTAAACAKLFSFLLPAHDAARLATALYVAIALAFTAAAGRELHGANRGWVATLVLLGSVGLAVRAHQLIPDTALFAGFAIGCYGLALMPRRALVGGAWLGTGAGVCFMAKGLFGPGALAFSALILIAACSAWRRRALQAIAVGCAAALPWLTVWPFALYRESSVLFAEWWGQLFACLLGTELPGAYNDRWHYVRILPWYAWPALPLALWVLWGTRVSRFGRPAIQLPVVVFSVAFVMLFACTPARELYAMPLLVPLTLLATPAVDNLRRGAANSMYWFGVMAYTFFACVAWFYWVGLELGVPQRLSEHLHEMQPAYASHVRWLPFLIAAAFCAAWVALLARLPRMPERPIVVWAAGMTLVWALLNTLFLAYADASKSYRGMIAELKRSLPADYDCISSRSLGESQRAMLHYLAGIVTYREEVPARRRSCDLMLAQGLRSSPPEIPPGWHQIWEGTRPGESDEYFWLYGYGPPQPLQ
jgi:4-amino-4-deoxy-L-arabinose transferase-like glycosyltransferase